MKKKVLLLVLGLFMLISPINTYACGGATSQLELEYGEYDPLLVIDVWGLLFGWWR